MPATRIVAGPVDCLIVVESAASGASSPRGSPIHIRATLFAVPVASATNFGRMQQTHSPVARAHLITGADDLIEAMQWPVRGRDRPAVAYPELSPADQAIIDLLSERGEARPRRDCIGWGSLSSKIMAALVDLEFKVRAIAFPGGLYRPA